MNSSNCKKIGNHTLIGNVHQLMSQIKPLKATSDISLDNMEHISIDNNSCTSEDNSLMDNANTHPEQIKNCLKKYIGNLQFLKINEDEVNNPETLKIQKHNLHTISYLVRKMKQCKFFSNEQIQFFYKMLQKFTLLRQTIKILYQIFNENCYIEICYQIIKIIEQYNIVASNPLPKQYQIQHICRQYDLNHLSDDINTCKFDSFLKTNKYSLKELLTKTIKQSPQLPLKLFNIFQTKFNMRKQSYTLKSSYDQTYEVFFQQLMKIVYMACQQIYCDYPQSQDQFESENNSFLSSIWDNNDDNKSILCSDLQEQQFHSYKRASSKEEDNDNFIGQFPKKKLHQNEFL